MDFSATVCCLGTCTVLSVWSKTVGAFLALAVGFAVYAVTGLLLVEFTNWAGITDIPDDSAMPLAWPLLVLALAMGSYLIGFAYLAASMAIWALVHRNRSEDENSSNGHSAGRAKINARLVHTAGFCGFGALLSVGILQGIGRDDIAQPRTEDLESTAITVQAPTTTPITTTTTPITTTTAPVNYVVLHDLPTALKLNASTAHKTVLQEVLRARGYDDVLVDGVWGPITDGALVRLRDELGATTGDGLDRFVWQLLYATGENLDLTLPRWALGGMPIPGNAVLLSDLPSGTQRYTFPFKVKVVKLTEWLKFANPAQSRGEWDFCSEDSDSRTLLRMKWSSESGRVLVLTVVRNGGDRVDLIISNQFGTCVPS